MSTPSDALTLAHWRRTVAELYAAVRAGQAQDPREEPQRIVGLRVVEDEAAPMRRLQVAQMSRALAPDQRIKEGATVK